MTSALSHKYQAEKLDSFVYHNKTSHHIPSNLLPTLYLHIDYNINSLVQDCGISNALAMEIPQYLLYKAININ